MDRRRSSFPLPKGGRQWTGHYRQLCMRQATVYAALGLLSVMGLIGCSTPGITIQPPTYVRFHMQMWLIVDADHIQVLVQ